jgi:hypothetical protein
VYSERLPWPRWTGSHLCFNVGIYSFSSTVKIEVRESRIFIVHKINKKERE